MVSETADYEEILRHADVVAEARRKLRIRGMNDAEINQAIERFLDDLVKQLEYDPLEDENTDVAFVFEVR